MNNLSSYGNFHSAQQFLSLTDIEGETVVINRFKLVDGNYGTYARMEVTLSDGQNVLVSTGARLIMDALRAAEKDNAFPVTAKFTHSGRAWVCE